MKNRSILGLIAVLLVGGLFIFGPSKPASADVVQSHFNELPSTPAKQHDAEDTADSTDWKQPLAPARTYGNPKMTTEVYFSGSTANCLVECGLYVKEDINADGDLDDAGDYRYLGPAPIDGQVAPICTLIATAHTVDTSLYAQNIPVVFNLQGATYYDLRVISLSNGTITTRPWVYGAKTRGQ